MVLPGWKLLHTPAEVGACIFTSSCYASLSLGMGVSESVSTRPSNLVRCLLQLSLAERLEDSFECSQGEKKARLS